MIDIKDAYNTVQKNTNYRYRVVECREYNECYRFYGVGRWWNGFNGRPQMQAAMMEIDKNTGECIDSDALGTYEYTIIPLEKFLSEEDVRFAYTYWKPFSDYGLIERAKKYTLSAELLLGLLQSGGNNHQTDEFYNFILYYADNNEIRKRLISLLKSGADVQAIYETAEDFHENILPIVENLVEAYQLLENHILPEDEIKEIVETDDFYIFNVAYSDRQWQSYTIVTKIGGKVWESNLYYGNIIEKCFKESATKYSKNELYRQLASEAKKAEEQFYISRDIYPRQWKR